MNPISSRWQEIRTARGLRRALVLLDVAYLVQATLLPSSADRPGIDLQSISAIFSPNVKAHLGLTDFPALLSLPPPAALPRSRLIGTGSIDLGWVLSDTGKGKRGQFARLFMNDGEIDFARQDRLMRAS